MKSIRAAIFAFSLVISSLFSFAVFASDYDVLIQDLAGDDEAKRVVARQMLPREGMRAFPDLLNVLQDDDQRVWRTARNVLFDICVAVTAPGYEADRDAATDQLMTLLESDVDLHVTVEVIRLLGKVAPEGRDLHTLTPFFVDRAFRSDAIDALVAMSTGSAVEVLESQLSKGSTQDKVEIIDALRTVGLRTDYVVPESLLSKREIAVQVAAMRALASTGNPGLVAPFLKILEKSEGDDETQALDATLHLADSILRNGGNWDAGLDLYRTLFNDVDSFSAKGAALAGLGRYGDARIVAEIVAVSHEAAFRDLEAPALMALDYLRGKESYEALLAAYPDASDEMQLGLLGVMGRKKDPVFLELLLRNARSDDPSRQALAFEALIQSELPDGVDAVTAYVKSQPEDERKFDVENLLAYADTMSHKNADAAAGKAYLAVYTTTDNEEFREIAFQGIKQYPSMAAYKIILADLDLSDLSDVPEETIISLNVMLDPAEYPDEIAALRGALSSAARTPSSVQAVLNMANQRGISAEFVPMMGFITRWHLAGPFPWSQGEGFKANPVSAPSIDLSATYSVGDQQRTWKQHDSSHMIDFVPLLGEYEGATLYAHATIHSDEATDAQIRIGSDDGARVWLNGESLYEDNEYHGIGMDQAVIPVKLHEGKNILLVQVTQGGGGWGLMIRVTKPDGTPIRQ